MEYATFTKHQPGIYLISYGSKAPSRADLLQHLKELELLYTTEPNMVVIFDGSRMTGLSSDLRKEWAQWMRDHQELTRRGCLCQLYVLSSPLARFVFQGIFLLQKPPVSFRTLPSIREAKELAEAIIEEMKDTPDRDDV